MTAREDILSLLGTIDDLSNNDPAIVSATQAIRDALEDFKPDKDVEADLAIYKQWHQQDQETIRNLQSQLVRR